MHVGKSVDGKIKAFNTECVFLSPPQFSDNNIPYWQEDIEVDNANYFLTDSAREER